MPDQRVIAKVLAGAEDLLLGEGVVTQSRNGLPVNVTKVGATSLPYATDPSSGEHTSIKTKIESMDKASAEKPHNEAYGLQGGVGPNQYYHISTNQAQAFAAANAPSSSNPVATILDLPVGTDTNHNNLTNLQGGAVDEYFHLTDTQNDALLAASAPSGTNPLATVADLPEAAITQHNLMGGLQGGTANEYFHLNLAQHAAVAGNTSLADSNPVASREELGAQTNLLANGWLLSWLRGDDVIDSRAGPDAWYATAATRFQKLLNPIGDVAMAITVRATAANIASNVFIYQYLPWNQTREAYKGTFAFNWNATAIPVGWAPEVVVLDGTVVLFSIPIPSPEVGGVRKVVTVDIPQTVVGTHLSIGIAWLSGVTTEEFDVIAELSGLMFSAGEHYTGALPPLSTISILSETEFWAQSRGAFGGYIKGDGGTSYRVSNTFTTSMPEGEIFAAVLTAEIEGGIANVLGATLDGGQGIASIQLDTPIPVDQVVWFEIGFLLGVPF